MALDRNNRDIPYVSGRMIAIAEHYAGNKFGPGTLANMFTHPNLGVHTWLRYIDKSDEYYQELEDFQLPDTTANEVAKGQAWIGYYHQKAEYEDTKHGGYRIGGGRPATDRNVAVTVRISQEAADKLKTVKNKSEFIDRIIKENV